MAARKTSAKKTSKSISTPRKISRKISPRSEKVESRMVTVKPQETSVPPVKPTKSPSKLRRPNKTFIIFGIIVVILLLLYLFRSAFVVAFVNGQMITRSEFNHQMEKDAGKQAMNEILTQDLIFQEAQKKHITVSQSDINSEMKAIEATLKQQGQTLSQALTAKGLTQQDLEDQIRIKVIVDKILGSQIKITDAQVNDYIDKNKDSLPQGQDTNSLRPSIKQRMYQDALNTKFQSWIQELQQKAKINYLDKSLAQ